MKLLKILTSGFIGSILRVCIKSFVPVALKFVSLLNLNSAGKSIAQSYVSINITGGKADLNIKSSMKTPLGSKRGIRRGTRGFWGIIYLNGKEMVLDMRRSTTGLKKGLAKKGTATCAGIQKQRNMTGRLKVINIKENYQTGNVCV